MRWTQYAFIYAAFLFCTYGIKIPATLAGNVHSDVLIDYSIKTLHSQRVASHPSWRAARVYAREPSQSTRSKITISEAEHRKTLAILDAKKKTKAKSISTVNAHDIRPKDERRQARINRRLKEKKAKDPGFDPAGKRKEVEAKRKEGNQEADKKKAGKKVNKQKNKPAPKPSKKSPRPKWRKVGKSAFSETEPILTSHLRGYNYRQEAIHDSPHDEAYYKEKYAADHLLELQAVTHHINTFRKSESHRTTKSKECVDELKKHLNDIGNVEMVLTKINSSKGFATTAFLKGKRTSHFTPEVQDHILTHQGNMLDTADKLDDSLSSDKCGKMPRGMAMHAKSMIDKAKELRSKAKA